MWQKQNVPISFSSICNIQTCDWQKEEKDRFKHSSIINSVIQNFLFNSFMHSWPSKYIHFNPKVIQIPLLNCSVIWLSNKPFVSSSITWFQHYVQYISFSIQTDSGPFTNKEIRPNMHRMGSPLFYFIYFLS